MPNRSAAIIVVNIIARPPAGLAVQRSAARVFACPLHRRLQKPAVLDVAAGGEAQIAHGAAQYFGGATTAYKHAVSGSTIEQLANIGGEQRQERRGGM